MFNSLLCHCTYATCGIVILVVILSCCLHSNNCFTCHVLSNASMGQKTFSLFYFFLDGRDVGLTREKENLHFIKMTLPSLINLFRFFVVSVLHRCVNPQQHSLRILNTCSFLDV